MVTQGLVLYDFEAQIASEVSVKAGDKIIVQQDNGDGWSTIKVVSTGKSGYIPSAYFETTDELDVEEQPKPPPFKPKVSVPTTYNTSKEPVTKVTSSPTSANDPKRISVRPTVGAPKVGEIKVPTEEPAPQVGENGEELPPVPKIRGKKDSRSPRNPPKINKNDATKMLRENLKIFLLRKRLAAYQAEKDFRSARTRNELIRETISTERSYVNSLKVFVNVFYEPLKKQPQVLSEQKLKAIFSNVGQILSINQVLLQDLDVEIEKWPNGRISGCFKKMAPFLLTYTTYVNNYDNAFNLMTAEQKTNTKFRDFLTEAQKDPQTERHPIGSFLIMPVQRIPRYKMLLADILKNMPEDHVEAKDMNDALTNISKIAVGVNESKRHNENSQTILQLSQTLKTLKNPYASLVQPNRSLVREGTMKVRCTMRDFTIDSYSATLCTDMLILLQNNPKVKDKKRACYYIFFSFCKMLNSKDDRSYDINLEVIAEGQTYTYTLVLNDVEEKGNWANDIEECIEGACRSNQLKLGSRYQEFNDLGTKRNATSSDVKQNTTLFQNLAKDHVATEKKLTALDQSLKANEIMLKKLIETINSQKEDLARTEEQIQKLEEQQRSVNATLQKELNVVCEQDSLFLEALKEEKEAFRVIFGEMPIDQGAADQILVASTPRVCSLQPSSSDKRASLSMDSVMPSTPSRPLPTTNSAKKAPPPPPNNKPVLKESFVPTPAPNKPAPPPPGKESPVTPSPRPVSARIDKVEDKPAPSWKKDIVNKTPEPISPVSKPLPVPKKLPATPPTTPPSIPKKPSTLTNGTTETKPTAPVVTRTTSTTSTTKPPMPTGAKPTTTNTSGGAFGVSLRKVG